MCCSSTAASLTSSVGWRPRRSHLDLRFRTLVTKLEPGAVNVGDERIEANAVVIAAGGIGGNLDIVRKHWPKTMGAAPAKLLMGSHYYADGAMHQEAERLG